MGVAATKKIELGKFPVQRREIQKFVGAVQNVANNDRGVSETNSLAREGKILLDQEISCRNSGKRATLSTFHKLTLNGLAISPFLVEEAVGWKKKVSGKKVV